jgi:hypothetical protein
MAQRGELFSSRANTDKRTYFFNVKENRTNDLFLNIVESRKRESAADGTGRGFERASLMVYEEDLEAFVAAFEQAVGYARRNRRRAERDQLPYAPKSIRPPARDGQEPVRNE